MTSKELLVQEFMKNGYTSESSARQGVNSKAAETLLGIIANNPDKYFQADDLEKDIVRLTKERDNLKRSVDYLRRDIDVLKSTLAQMREEEASFVERTDEYINGLLNAETAEGRDAMRKAQLFVNSVDIDTKYDNTAFIIALGEILAQSPAGGAIDKLKKINNKFAERVSNPWGERWTYGPVE